MLDQQNVEALMGATVHDSSGDKIGKAGQVYLDDQTGQPQWVTVNTGMFGTKESFVPISDASLSGDVLTVQVTKDQVKDAPRVDSDGHITPEEEADLYRHYGLGNGYDSTTDTDTGTTTGTADYSADTQTDYRTDVDTTGTVGRDTSGPTTDDAMTRSEERLDVGTERVEAGRARLRKYITTRTESVQVPVSREEIRVEREPITDANRGDALSGPDLSEEEHEVTLYEERAVVNKETVPVERVRLDTDTVTDTEQVSAEVRAEQIEVDSDGQTTRSADADRL